MLIAISALLISLIIFGINYYISRDIFYPPSLFCLIWCIVFFSYVVFLILNSSVRFELDIKTLFIFILGEIVFSVFALLAFSKVEVTEIKKSTILYSIDKWLLLFLILMLPIYVNALIKIVSQSKFANVNFYLALRHEYVNNGIKLGVLDYLNTISVFSFALALFRFNFTDFKANKNFKNKIYKFLCYLIAFTYAFLTTGRTYFVMLISIYIGYKVVSKSFKRKHIVVAATFFLLIFITNALLLNKGASVDDSASDNASSIFESISIYFLGGAYGFDSFMHSNFSFDLGENVFRFFVSVGHTLGFTDVAPKELVMPYITTPIVSNVYSLYFNYFKDFGYFGILFNGIWGFIHTFFYRRVKSSFISLYCYSFLLYPLIMSFFQDQYMSLLSTWIQLIFYGLIANFFIAYNRQTTPKTINGN